MTDAPTREAIDWSGIRAAAVLVGIRQAARQACSHLPPDEQARFIERVMKRASREGWLDKAKEDKALAATTSPTALSANVRTGAEIMSAMSADSKLQGATALQRGLTRFAELEPDEVIDKADKFKALVSTGTPLHGWNDRSGAEQPAHVINVQLMCMDAAQARIVDGPVVEQEGA